LQWQKPLTKLKEQITDTLSKIPGPVVVVLDDIDRMEPNMVLITLKMVKLLSNFPKIIFILPFDYNRIASLITKDYSEDYNDYLNKIINERIPLPLYTYKQLYQIFLHSRNEFHSEVLQSTFENEILRLKVKQIQDISKDRERQIKDNSSAFIDPFRYDFEGLFRKLNTKRGFQQYWGMNYKDQRTIYPLQESLIGLYNGLSSESFLSFDQMCQEIQQVIKLWINYDFFLAWNGPLEQLSTSSSSADHKQCLENMKKYSKHITEYGHENTTQNLEYCKKEWFDKLFDDEHINELSINDDNNNKDIKRFKTEFVNHYELMTGNDYTKIKDWLVESTLTARDVKKLAVEVLSQNKE